MRMTVIAIGYRGDVQPSVALATGLQRAGHTVRVATHADFEELVVGAGLAYFPLPGGVSQFIGGPAGAALRDRFGDPKRFARFVESYLYPFLRDLLRSVWLSCQDAEAIFGWSLTRMMPSLAERLRVPCFIVAPYPLPHLSTRHFPFPYQGATLPRSRGCVLNRLSWLRGRQFQSRFAQPVIDEWRCQELGLPPQSWRAELRELLRMPHLLGFSSLVLARPPDWPRHVHTPGYWVLPAGAGYTPPSELEEFLSVGPPPIVFGFSSQASRDSTKHTEMVLESLRRTGARGVLLTGWGGLRAKHVPREVLQIASAPHDWLYPKALAVVHHGGCGSTAAALRAGVPNMAVTFGYDQPLWGRQLSRLGFGPEPIPVSTLCVDGLTRAIEQVASNPSFRARAQEFAVALRAENGVERSVEIASAYLGH